MKAEIIAVGTELITGDIVNTNAQYLSRRLMELGIEVTHHVTVDDHAPRLKRALVQAIGRSNIILVTGGLGPTPDDITKETICEALRMELSEHTPSLEKMQAYFDRLGRPMPDINRKQAMMPEGATVLDNDFGTAPGCALEAGDQCIIMLPGPPRELIPMFENQVLNFLNKYLDGVIVTHTVRTFGIGESTIAERLQDLLTAKEPRVATYAAEGEVRIKITASGEKRSECEALCREAIRVIRERLGDTVYAIDQPNLESVVVEELRRRGLKIAVAESCTAGLLAKRLTDIAGASEVFEGGMVTYSNQMKRTLLGVSNALLEEHGAVSEPVAKEMARGAMRVSHAGLGIGITGIAGPGGGTEEKPVGLVWLSLTNGQTIWTRKLLAGHGGNEREFIRTLAASHALDMIRLYLAEAPDFMEQGIPIPGAEAIVSVTKGPLPTPPLDLEPAPVPAPEAEPQADGWDFNVDNLPGSQQTKADSEQENAPKKLPWYTRLRRFFLPVKGDPLPEVLRKMVLTLSLLAILIAGSVIARYYIDTLIQNANKPFGPAAVGEAVDRDPSVPAEVVDRFAALWMQNSDIKGWLTIPNTQTNNPVVQSSKEDPEFYLKRLFDKTSNRYGTIFLDAVATMTPDRISQNLVLYGHNMKDGQMLGEAQKKYRQLSFYKENPVIQFDTIYDDQPKYWKVFSVFITNVDPDQDNGYVFPSTQPNFSSQAEFLHWIEQVRSRSLYRTSVDVKEGDRVLTLSTCTYEIPNARLVIMARLVRDGESTEVDVSAAKTNNNIVYPQAWCDKFNVTKESEVAHTLAPSKPTSASSSQPVESEEEESSAESTASSKPTTSKPSSKPSTNSRPQNTTSSNRPESSSAPSSDPSQSSSDTVPSDAPSEEPVSEPTSSEAPPEEPVSSEAPSSETPPPAESSETPPPAESTEAPPASEPTEAPVVE